MDRLARQWKEKELNERGVICISVKSLVYIFSCSFGSAVDDKGANESNEPNELDCSLDDSKWPCIL